MLQKIELKLHPFAGMILGKCNGKSSAHLFSRCKVHFKKTLALTFISIRSFIRIFEMFEKERVVS